MATIATTTAKDIDNTYDDPKHRAPLVLGGKDFNDVTNAVCNVAERPTTLAIVPAGYADGLDLRLAGRGVVLIRGRRAPIVGSVCMDMLMADVTGMDVSPGDEVVIIGAQGDDRIDAREMAAAVGTIPWEVVCRVGSRIERVYR